MTYIKNFIVLFSLLSLAACSDSKLDKLITSFSNDLNATSLATNRASQIRVYANYDDGTKKEISKDLIWSSSNESIATVKSGLVQTHNLSGDVEIKYETSSKKDDGSAMYEKTLYLSVKNLLLKKITLSKSTLSLGAGESSDIYAQGTFEDNITLETITQDITNDASWSSLDNNISSVSLTGSKAVIKAMSEGDTTIIVSDSDINATLNVQVTQPTYTSVKIFSDKTTFNVNQTIKLEARATTKTGEVVILDNNHVTWSSSDRSIVTVDASTAIATAIAHGDATITATINATNTTDTLVLSVDKENYVRLFKDKKEVALPYVASESNSSLGLTLGTFTLLAVGEDFQVESVVVKDFNGNSKSDTEANFDGLQTSDYLYKDENKTFSLKQDGVQTQLNFTFDINDSTKSSFSQKYEKRN